MRQTIYGMIALASFVIGAGAIESNLVISAIAGIAGIAAAAKGELWEIKE